MNGFTIDLFDAKLQGRQFAYTLDDEFFKQIEGMIDRGDVNAVVTCKKAGGQLYEFDVQAKGVVTVPCDRCLSDLELRIDLTEKLKVKLGADYDDDGEVITVPEEDGALDISIPLYELIVLSLPLRRVHEPGMCDEAMIQTVESYLTDRSEYEEPLEEDEGEVKSGFEGLARLKEILENNNLKN